MSVASVKFDEMSPQYRETDLNYINKVESREHQEHWIFI